MGWVSNGFHVKLVRLRRRALAATLVAVGLAASPLVPARAASVASTPAATLSCRGDAPGSVVAPSAMPARVGEPVLLVHGTFTTGDENYKWALAEHLAKAGLNVCWFDYPNRGLDDMQAAGEMTANAIVQVAKAAGGQVDVLGHSQGAILPRWAVRWFPEAAAAVDDLVLLAGPHHGTSLTSMYGKVPSAGCSPLVCTAAMWQFSPDSQFTAALNRDYETDDAHDVTNLYTLFDQLVRHDIGSVNTRAEVEDASKLADDGDPGGVVNILMQDLCPGRPVDHIGLFIDHVMARLAIDAFTRAGPADPGIIGPQDCARGPFDGFDALVGLPILPNEVLAQRGVQWTPMAGEPEIRPYAS